MKESLFLKELDVHPDWFPFLSDEIIKIATNAGAEVTRSVYTPAPEKVLRFLALPLVASKVVILGQDPYPQPGIATGRAFEVGTLQSWSQPFQNVSLKNILRAVYKAYTGEIIVYKQLKDKIYTDFPILPPDQLFKHWESQGVLLLNTSFTCQPGKPGSHKNLWESFTRNLLNYIAEKAPHITWFIWGNHAAGAIKDIPLQNVIATMHPMMCYHLPHRSNDFLYGKINCFEPFIPEIDWTGYGFNSQRQQQQLLF